MAYNSIKADIDYGSIDRRYTRSIGEAQKWLDNEIMADTTQFLPWRTGALEKSATNPLPGRIEYNTPYARRLYFGDHMQFNKSHHPLAGAYWFERSKAVNGNKWVDGVSKIVKMRKG